MKYRDLSLIGMGGLVVATLQLLAQINKPPEMPRDFPHSTVSRNVREQCLRCHQRNGQEALNAAMMIDPPHQQPRLWRAGKSDCLLCHHPATQPD